MAKARIPFGGHGNVKINPTGQTGLWLATTSWRHPDTGKVSIARKHVDTDYAPAATRQIELHIEELIGRRVDVQLDKSSSVRMLVDAWTEQILDNPQQNNFAVQTVPRYRASAKVLVALRGDKRLDEIGPGDLMKMLSALNSRHHSSARNLRVVTKHIFKWAFMEEITATDYSMFEIQLRDPTPKERPKAIAEDKIGVFFQAFDDYVARQKPGPKSSRQVQQARDVCDIAFGLGGLRIDEAAAIFAEDIEDHGEKGLRVFVNRGVKYQEPTGDRRIPDGRKKAVYDSPGFFFVEGHTKPHSRRWIWADEVSTETLRRLVSENSNGLLLRVEGSGGDGRPLNLNNIRRTLRAVVGGTEFEAFFTPHTLRRTAGTHIAREFGIAAAADTLGHASTATTVAHYIEREDEAPDMRTSLSRLRTKR
ncbi:tyrosine-type recombinase/integrase [Gryllotalpicola reticulitermitis]|uniref:Tyrosine-type recombinase/integrase n=1 Tax=Gryllotalpicola reticulitermitis TaxID=1184153 RepID=A0ABV8Q5B6_9MICO